MSDTNGFGALSARQIRELIKQGHIKNVSAEENVRPGSLDLSITSEVYRIEEVFLPRPGESMRDILRLVHPTPHHLSHPLERDVTYIARIQESLSLPSDIFCICNPKSSTGRVDIQVRIIADGVSRYDTIMPGGYSGDLWTLITPKSFPILLTAGETLSQVRFYNKDTTLTSSQLADEYNRTPLIWNTQGEQQPFDEHNPDHDNHLILSIDLSNSFVGWECLGVNKILDLTKRASYTPKDFFSPVHRTQDFVRLHQGGMYILYTRERVVVPPHLCCEIVPMDERTGEFRAHYAGFVDPGWGWGQSGEAKGRPLVLELRPFEDIVLRDRQPVTKIRYSRLAELPETFYDDAAMGSNYSVDSRQIQGLSKHFNMAAQ
ncbi:MAG: 2'-deoxycytidine 5'-triphosphate deaminase [bacterium]|nr:2'-deoxycytidine 5'-triphosphate deaminase [bacterium]